MVVLFIILILLCAAVVLGLIFFGADYISGRTETISVTVMEKSYSPAKFSSGIATGVTSTGGVGTGVVFTSQNEKCVLVVKDSKGEVFSHETDVSTFANVNKGDKINIDIRIGGISKCRI